MIWRFTLVFLTSLTAVTLSTGSLRAEDSSHLIAQTSIVDPNAAVDTGQAIPTIRGVSAGSPLQNATSEQQIQEIKAIQQELKNRGFYNGPVDGLYGPGTAAAIRNLRGQQGNQLPQQLIPQRFPNSGSDAFSAEIAAPDARTSQTNNVGVTGDTAVSTGSVSSDAEPVDIGDEVSPETGVPDSDAEAAAETSEDTVNAAGSAATTSPGLGAILWPGLALVAALGSFGTGFVLANRRQTKADDKADLPWGDVPSEVPPATSKSVALPQSSQNGGSVTNGVGPHHETELAIHQSSSRLEERLPVVSPDNRASIPTQLVKSDVIEQLVVNLQVDDPVQRRKAIWELGQRGNSSAVQHLVNGMVDADSKEKSLILAALSEIGIRSLKPMSRALAIALQDDNPDVRKNAIRDLTRVYDLVTQISQMLGHATEDEDPEVRRTAEWALGQLNRIREAPKLTSSLNTALEASRSSSELLPDEIENLKN